MSRVNRQIQTKGAEEARKQLPALVAAAAEGRTTIITRHGRAVAAVVPAESISRATKQSPITPIAGTGKGLWEKDSTLSIAKLRDEWSR
jgi:prevent-host-death family protein